MWLICRYFDRYHGKTGNALTWYSGKIERSIFSNHVLWEKHFKEGLIEFLQRYIHLLFGKWMWQGERSKRRLNERTRIVKNTINRCIEKDYLLLEDDEINLRMDYRGRDFLRPIYFLNAVAKEFGPLKSFLAGTGIGAVIWTSLVFISAYFWPEIISLTSLIKVAILGE